MMKKNFFSIIAVVPLMIYNTGAYPPESGTKKLDFFEFFFSKFRFKIEKQIQNLGSQLKKRAFLEAT